MPFEPIARPSHLPAIEATPTSVSLISVGLVTGLALVIIGSLAIVAVSYPEKALSLRGLEQIGLEGGIALTTIGSVQFILFTVSATQLKWKIEDISDRNNEIHQKRLAESIRIDVIAFHQNHWFETYTQHKWDKFPKPTEEETRQQERNRLNQEKEAKKAACQEVIEQLKTIYAQQKDLPFIYNPFLDENMLKEQMALILLSSQAILELKLTDIRDFKQHQMHILLHRLVLIDREMALFRQPEDVEETLYSLRALTDRDQILEKIRDEPNWACLLKGEQIALLLKKESYFQEDVLNNPAWIHAILPLATESERGYCRMRLAYLATLENVAPLLAQLPPNQLLLLPDDYFIGPHWNWTKERIEQLLITMKPHMATEVERVVQTLRVSTINAHISTLTNEHFLLFTDKQLSDKDFPWVDYSQKEGWGRVAKIKIELVIPEAKVHTEGKIPILETTLPWKQMNKEQLVHLFEVEPYQSARSFYSSFFQDLSRLSIETILILRSIWKLNHLRHFSEKNRANKAFPWDEMIKPRIGQELRACYSASPSLIGAISFPWEKLDSKEVNSLFLLDDPLITNALFGALSIEVIQIIIPHLTAEHLSCMPTAHFKNKDFPWKIALQKQGIGAVLYERRILITTIQEQIPWASLRENETEGLFNSLLSDDSWWTDRIKFFQSFKTGPLTQLASKLSAGYFARLHGTQLNDKDFPWNAFIGKEGIGFNIRKRFGNECVIKGGQIPLDSIPWGTLIKNEKEMESLFVEGTDIAALIQRLRRPTLTLIHSFLGLKYFHHFSFEQLTQELPWPVFTNKEGIGLKLQKVFNNYSGDILIKPCATLASSIPWSEFATVKPEEFQQIFNDFICDKQKLMKMIPDEDFQKLLDAFGKGVFDAIKLYSESYLRDNWYSSSQNKMLTAPTKT